MIFFLLWFLNQFTKNVTILILQSSSSTESESIPFANDNAGTIKQQKPGSRSAAGAGPALDGIYGTTGASANASGMFFNSI